MRAEEADDQRSATSIPGRTAGTDLPAGNRPSNPGVADHLSPEKIVESEQAKHCCICGLDVTQKKRSRDHAGRYWCAHCHDFISASDKSQGTTPCPDCGRETRETLMVEQAGVKVCPFCHQIFLAEAEPRRLHKAAVTANPEVQIRTLIRTLVNTIVGLAIVAAIVTAYHFGLLYVRPKAWVPFVSALYTLGIVAAGIGIAIAIQYLRIAYRRSMRRAEYDRMIQAAANQILAIDDESHSMGISESPEPLRRRAERAISRVEACAGKGSIAAGSILEALAEKGNPDALIRFLISQRPETDDALARNREIATVSYLYGDFTTATSAVTSILLRLHNDQEAMTRRALICFRTGDLEQAKKIFKRVIYTAREKKIELDLAEAYCNLGMLHLMLSEYDDADVRYSQAMQIYNRLSREEGQADCLLNLGLIAYRQKKGAAVEDNFRRAMAINKRRNRPEGLSICCSLLGVILIEKEPPQLREAERVLNRALQLNVQLGRPGGVAAAYGNLGLVKVKKGDLAGARDLFLKAQSIYQRISRPKMMAKIQGMLKTVGTMSAASNK